ncbi:MULTISPECIES: NYN domain-containing protein [unclassified Paenibacillus]|uniref:NYN domain-containing protein n=1 Tax=unclassified Paenibacillus TaxID=185978 RepID=UPI0024064D32|nr:MULTISPECIES: NYN domain-containing protein [unclassified Paenibacillus]MDF9844420.1 putative RNA-binding protein with PIN domain [Paenibacillus sp. PastF-2]MDF9851024.1 putative RNA-binding protein with PIN domain [Paenibacillus sp. PastM-2]MDF9857647.1 putative RNA-binding protein with PIN domain [Paenibacillus sp. PastF-1]MDH6482862.1 putative RNA-binding protein with PIN domain [Paenibacillus sp. PastH-2]MDH6510287.1 putative RNA-binding protein with PIN domain [Paenibacillus sp. PastM-
MADWRDVLLVDGYNMIGGWPELAALSLTGMQEARDRLLDMLADYQAFTGRRVIAVFDAYRVPGLGRSFVQGKVQVVFTKEKETADECIERLVGEYTHRRRQIYVATSDFVEQHVIFAQGALRVSARELKVEIEDNQKLVKKAIEPESISSKRHSLEEKLPPDMRKRLEDWRRQ